MPMSIPRTSLVPAWSTRQLILVFVLLDVLAYGLYTLFLRDVLHSRFFHLSRDRGFCELVQYLKYGLVMAMLVEWKRRRPSPLLGAWVALLTILLLDDALGLHEFLGKILARATGVDTLWGREAKDVFEIAGFFLLEGIALLFVFARWLAAPRDLQRHSVALVLVMTPLVFSGIVLDALPWHQAEKIGQMLGASLVLAFVHIHHRRRQAAHTSGSDRNK
jgi:hypothetical protein